MIVMTKMKRQSYNGNWRRLSARGLRGESRKSVSGELCRGSDRLTTLIQEREKEAAAEAEREHDIALGNPLLNPKTDFNVKRR